MVFKQGIILACSLFLRSVWGEELSPIGAFKRNPLIYMKAITANETANFAPMIVGGEDAKPFEDYKFVVAIVTRMNGKLFQFCGGTLISKKFIVTAAHCVEAGYSMEAVIGRYSLSDESSGEIIKVVESHVNPNYNSESMAGDIALLKLERETQYEPINVVDEKIVSEIHPGDKSIVLGWGLLHEQNGRGANGLVSKGEPGAKEAVVASGDNILQSVELDIVSNSVCNSAYQAVTNSLPILDEQVCAGAAAGGLDSCQGDSGGPMIVRKEGKFYLMGVVSWGIGCGRPGIYGVYTRVGSHLTWLSSNMLLESSLRTRGEGAGNLFVSAVGKPARSTIKLTNISPFPLDLILGFVNGSSTFTVDLSTISIPSAQELSFVVSFLSHKETIDQAVLQTSVPGKMSNDYILKGMAIAEKSFDDFKSTQKWYSGGEGSWTVAKKFEVDVPDELANETVLTSGVTPNKGASCLLTYFEGPGTLSFYWKVASEETYDFLYFVVGLETQGAISGTTSFEKKEAQLPAGENAVSWCYMKDKSVSEGSDQGQIAKVEFTPAAASRKRNLRA